MPVVTNNYTISPDGTKNASRVQLDIGNGTISNDYSQVAVSLGSLSGDFTNSVYIKSNTSSNYNVVLTKPSGSFENKIITSEWQRFTATSLSATNVTLRVRLRGDEGTSKNADISVWGAQTEQLSYATSYIPTNGSTQTRAAETCNGAGTSSIFESTEGILYFEVAFNNLSQNNIALSDGTNDNRVTFVTSGTINRFKAQIKLGGSTVFSEHAQAIDNTQNFNKYAIKWKANDFALWCNGTERNTDTSGSTFSAGTLTTLRFDRGDGANDFHGKIRDIRVYNTKEMTDSEVDILLTKITS